MLALKDFTTLSKSESKMVWEWRNHNKVCEFMKTKNIPFEMHCAFLESLKLDSTKLYFLVFKDSMPIGVVDFVNIKKNESCEFGIYQNPNLHGFGKILMEAMLNYAKDTLKLKRIYACAFVENKRAEALYLHFGFKIYNKDKAMNYFSLLL